MTLDQAAHWAQTWGLLLLAGCFVVAVIYALWPSNKEKFDRAAHVPLMDDEDEDKKDEAEGCNGRA